MSRQSARSRWLTGLLVTVGVSLVLAGVLLAVAFFQAKAVKQDLEQVAAKSKVLEAHMRALDVPAARSDIQAIQGHTAAARRTTDNALWRMLSGLPFVGDDVQAVRVCTAAVDDIARSVMPELAATAESVDPKKLSLRGGSLPLAELVQAQAPLNRAHAALVAVDASVRGIDRGGLTGQVDGQVVQLQSNIGTILGTTDEARNIAVLMPKLLAHNSTRHVLVLFQNNAEVRGSGGIPGALALMKVSDGKMTIVAQKNTSDFKDEPEPLVPLGYAGEIYTDKMGQYIQNVTMSPDFSLAARLAKAMWEKNVSGPPVDEVLAVDPVALSYMMPASGGIDVPPGPKLTRENLASYLLHEAYGDITNPAMLDRYFAVAAHRVFTQVTTSLDGQSAIDAVRRATRERRILVWSNQPEEQQVLERTPLGRILAKDGKAATGEVGIMLNDSSAAKMSYFLDAHVTFRPKCVQVKENAEPEFAGGWTGQLTLTSAAPADAARSLPSYVVGTEGTSIPKGSVRTGITIYGPAKATLGSVVTGDGRAFGVISSHLNRDVAVVTSVLKPQESQKFTFDVTGVESPELELRMSPLTKPHKVDILPGLCSVNVKNS